MYRLKENLELKIANKKKLAEEVGIYPETLSRIISRKQDCSKVVAYSISKHLCEDMDISDFFERID